MQSKKCMSKHLSHSEHHHVHLLSEKLLGQGNFAPSPKLKKGPKPNATKDLIIS